MMRSKRRWAISMDFVDGELRVERSDIRSVRLLGIGFVELVADVALAVSRFRGAVMARRMPALLDQAFAIGEGRTGWKA